MRNVWAAMGGHTGMRCADWAECGIGGAPEAFFDVYAGVLGNGANPAALTAGLGQRWSILEGYTKIYACCQHLHAAVEAAVAMRDDVLKAGSLEDVASIRVETHPLAIADARSVSTDKPVAWATALIVNWPLDDCANLFIICTTIPCTRS